MPGPSTLTRRLPSGGLARVRVLTLGLAVVGALTTAGSALTAHEGAGRRLVAGALAAALCVHWVAGHRRGRFPLAGEPLEALALLLVLRFTPGAPIVPLSCPRRSSAARSSSTTSPSTTWPPAR